MNTALKATVTTPTDATFEHTPKFLPALLALAFGVFMVFGAGLVQSSALHDAAHDARHAFLFPCH